MTQNEVKGFVFSAKVEDNIINIKANVEQDGSYLDEIPEAFVKMNILMQKGTLTLPFSNENFKLAEEFIKLYDKL